MFENGVKITGLDIIAAVSDEMYFAVGTASATERVSWASLKADMLGDYELWPHDIAGTTDEIVTLRNTSDVDEFSIFEIRSPENGATLESTLSLHCYSAALGKDWVRDLSLHNYSGSMRGIDAISCFTDETYADWKWVMNVVIGGNLTETTPMRLYGATGNLAVLGAITPTGGYKSADGSAGATGSHEGLTIKNGLVVAIA